jgi:hypothetical protein
MKYLGKNSLAGFLSVFLKVGLYIVLVGAAGTLVFGILVLFVEPVQDAITMGIASGALEDASLQDWQTFRDLHIGLKLLMFPYFGVFVWLLTRLIRKSQKLFANFRNDSVFKSENVALIKDLGKFLIIFSIITFNILSIVVGILLQDR